MLIWVEESRLYKVNEVFKTNYGLYWIDINLKGYFNQGKFK